MIRSISIATLFLTLLACSPRQSASSLLKGQKMNCAELWAHYAGETIPCEVFADTGFPRTIDGVDVGIVHYSEGWTAEQGQVDLLKLSGQAALDSIPVYRRFLRSNTIIMRLVPEISDDSVADAGVIDASEPCEIRIFMNMEMNPDVIKQVIAHEIFHCFQTSSISESGAPGSGYWMQGSADYFSNVVYPKVNDEHAFTVNYKPEVPLHKQPDECSTSIFFQSLATVQDDETIADSLRNFVTMREASAEYSIVAFKDVSQRFHKFAQMLIDHAVPDTGGGYVPSPQVNPLVFPARPESQELTLSALPYTVNYGHIFLPTSSRTKLSLPFAVGNKNIKLSVRLLNEPWREIEAGANGPLTFEVPCGIESRRLEIAWTTTALQGDAVTFPLKIKADGVMPCGCDDTNTELDACLVGNWDLSIDSMRQYMEKTSLGQIRNFQHSGGMTLEVNNDFGQYTYDALKINFDAGSDEQGLQHTKHTYDGFVQFRVQMQRQGEFCMKVKQANGGLVSETSLGRFDFSFHELYESNQGEARYQYTCDEHTLRIKTNVLDYTSPEMVYHRR